MKAPRKLRRVLTIAAVLLAALVTALPAYADPPGGGGGGDTGAGGGGNNFYAWVKAQVEYGGTGYDGTPDTPVSGGYDPPHCWYQPQYDYDEMFDWVGNNYRVWRRMGPEDQRDAHEWYEKTLAEIKPHEGETDKVFWFITDDGTDAGWDCFTRTTEYWVYRATEPPIDREDLLIDRGDLALMARANLTLPPPRPVTLNPPEGPGGYRTYVGLETMVNVPEAGQLEVTAHIPGVAYLTATVTAEPTYVTIEATGNYDDKRDHVARCPKYASGMDPKTGCYLRFTRASIGGPYTITVTQHWHVTSDVQAAGIDEDTGAPSEPVPVVVDEIQSVANG
ncbi:hypothetical protein [Planotetraspora mira]|uniref:Enoyl reductase n=1 Tax=Planotetraspora mira TaxID=58121 RepID=A0A8J3U9B7_9ACTN|nr:hypothetical protein [Planotetraspora mira]GII34920.1 hypothetical protein Pmi06nite_83620 [Planotetraspora mira]